MVQFDLDERALQAYRSPAVEPEDFDEFWAETLVAARRHPLALRREAVPSPLVGIDVFDVTFAGYGGHPIKAWLYLPRDRAVIRGGVVEYIGYEGGRGHPLEDFSWAASGYAQLRMDNRGMGSTWRVGDTPDPVGSGPSTPGFLTRGIESPHDYFYRRLYTDAVRAVDALGGFAEVDGDRLAVVGHSQGGALALAAGALRDDVRMVLSRQPALCDIRRWTTITDSGPVSEIARYLAVHRGADEQVFSTLEYFDGVHLAKRVTAPTWMVTGLMDEVCPPSTNFAAFHELAGPKTMRTLAYNGHEGGGAADDTTLRAALQEVLAA